MNYNRITHLEYECNCTDISVRKWESYMADCKRADKQKLNRLIKIFEPDLHFRLALHFYNPYNAYKTPSHLVLVHSGIEYFFKYKLG